MNEADARLTGQENAVYDRQLRVWGIHVQKQLQKAKILILGNSVLASEVAKNVVLAGVGSVHVHLSVFPDRSEPESNYLSHRYPDLDPSGAYSRVLQEMNPLVTIKTCPGTLLLSVDTVKEYDLVCMATGSLVELLGINKICREAQVRFCCGKCTGPFGWMFFDLLTHSYMADSKESPEARLMEFVQLEQAFKSPGQNLPKKLHGLYPVLRACLVFESGGDFSNSAKRGRSATVADIDELLEIAQKQFPDRRINDRILRQYLEDHPAFPPVASVMGGMLANEVVKIASFRGDPIQNFLFYDIFDGKGILHLIE